MFVYSQEEWLCLNCQTQRALLGQLGDSGKMPQPSPISAKPETQATPAAKKAESKIAHTKTEPTPVATKSELTHATTQDVTTVTTPKAEAEPISVQMETTATTASTQNKLEITLTPTVPKVQPVTAENQSTAENSMPPVQQTLIAPKVEVPNTEVLKTGTVESKEEAVEVKPSETEDVKSKPEPPKEEIEATVASSVPVTETTVAFTSPVAAEVAMFGVVPGTEAKSELSASGKITKEMQPHDQIKLTEPTEPLRQVDLELKSQEPQMTLEIESLTTADSKEVAEKLVEEITDVTSIPESQPMPAKNIIIKVRMALLHN